ncbi:alpha beta-hydrolase [Diaporthe eres]|nr:alpha beta-hydrolase [Diaporthe eres]
MSHTKPTIVIVPGAWQLTSAFAPFADLLRSKGFDTEIVDMPSVGGTELPLTGLPEDIAAVRAVIQPLVEARRELVLLTHSAGGVSGGGAVKGLDLKTRKEAGLPGGVVRVIYMAAFMVPKGSSLLQMLGGKPAPWMVLEGDRVTGDPNVVPELGFSDLPPEERQKWFKKMTHTSAALFAGVNEYEPWNGGVPCAYIFTEDDGALPYALQQQMAAQLQPGAPKILVKANHCPYLSVPAESLAAVEKIVAA